MKYIAGRIPLHIANDVSSSEITLFKGKVEAQFGKAEFVESIGSRDVDVWLESTNWKDPNCTIAVPITLRSGECFAVKFVPPKRESSSFGKLDSFLEQYGEGSPKFKPIFTAPTRSKTLLLL